MKLIEFQDQLTGIIEELSRSVVSVNSTKLATVAHGLFSYETVPVQGAGTGAIISSDGYVVTNNHVVDSAEKVLVTLQDGRALTGRIIGLDPATDIAVIKIDADHLPAVKLGDSEKLKRGHIVIAIGNALGLPGGHSVSTGIVSGLGRPLPGMDFIFEGLVQTDAAINPGNSGGPLADINGNVIGINTAVIASAQGMGFAIPSNTVKGVVEQILQNGRVIRPWLGLAFLDVDPAIVRRFNLATDSGVLIVQMVENGPAHRAGLTIGDIIKYIGPKEVKTTKDMLTVLSNAEIGKNVDISFLRGNRGLKTPLLLVEAPHQVRPMRVPVR